MAIKFRPWTISLACSLALALPAHADPATPDLKAEIDALIHRIDGASHGMLHWDGADKIDIHQDGAATVADIVNARIMVRRPPAAPPAKPAEAPKTAEPVAHVVLDRVEVRQTPAADGAAELTVTLPKTAAITGTGDEAATLTFDHATIHALIDAKTERAREVSAGFTSARLDDKATGSWITFGKLAGSYKLVAAADGSWTAPSSSELKDIAFFFPKGPVGGTIDRIAATGHAAGPNLAAANQARDRLNAMQQENLPPAERVQAFLTLLPDLLGANSQSKGTFTVDGVTVRKPTAAPLFSLKTASLEMALNGFSGDKASVRLTFKDDGLNVASSLPHADRVPRRGVVDFGLEDLSTASLRTIAAAAAKANGAATPPERQAANQQMMAAVAALTPVFRIYDLAFDLQDTGVEANGKATGSPLSPKGYTADADIAVRNLDELRNLVSGPPLAEYLPLLKVIGDTGTGSAPETKFHLASAPGKWLTLNGDDVTAWFVGRPPSPGEPRPLRPATPPLTGNDVRAVQHALADAKIEAPQNAVYDGATAAAVARFQKANGLNVNGVVGVATRQKLGIKPQPPEKKGQN